MRKGFLFLSAAIVLAAVPSTSVIAAAGAAKLRLPPPRAPKDQIYSPGAIAKDLEKRGYRIEKMKRKGTTYSITATGPNKNRVQMTVDGRSGDVVGLAVLQAAANLAGAIAAIVTSGKGNRYVDDWHPFGIIIPDTYQTRWTVIPTWNVYTTQYVTESWSGAGYRFAVPYASIRPGYNGMSVTTFAASDFGSPIYEVYDFNGTEISTDYSESSYEISATESFETSYETQNEQLEESYLGGAVDDDEVELGDVADYDSEDGDFSIADDADDDYDADFDDDSGDDDDQDVDDDDDQDVDDDDQDFDDEQDVDEPDDDGDYDDGGDDYDDGGDEPELSSVR